MDKSSLRAKHDIIPYLRLEGAFIVATVVLVVATSIWLRAYDVTLISSTVLGAMGGMVGKEWIVWLAKKASHKSENKG